MTERKRFRYSYANYLLVAFIRCKIILSCTFGCLSASSFNLPEDAERQTTKNGFDWKSITIWMEYLSGIHQRVEFLVPFQDILP